MVAQTNNRKSPTITGEPANKGQRKRRGSSTVTRTSQRVTVKANTETPTPLIGSTSYLAQQKISNGDRFFPTTSIQTSQSELWGRYVQLSTTA